MGADGSLGAAMGEAAPLRFAIVTLDNHLAQTMRQAKKSLRRRIPNLQMDFFAASDWDSDPQALERCKAAVERADIVLVAMLFMDNHISALLPTLAARRDQCDAMICILSAGEIVRLTKMGRLSMNGSDKGAMALLKKLRGAKKAGASSGAGQMAMLKRLPKILRLIPGTAQDLRAYFLTLQYWLAGSEENLKNLSVNLVNRYADGANSVYRGKLKPRAPVEYPEVGVYHPELPDRLTIDAARLPAPENSKGVVGLILLRSYLLANDSAHYDGVIAALEARGVRVVPVFSSGLDARPAIEKYLMKDGATSVDAVVSLTGFSLVGGPAYNDNHAAEETLAKLDAPYVSAHPLEFQTLEGWSCGKAGLTPVEATIMVAIPEIDGATGPLAFGGRSNGGECRGCSRNCQFDQMDDRQMLACPERADKLADRVANLVRLRRKPKRERKIAITLFNFPPNAGAVGTAAGLSVFESLFNALKALRSDGYEVDVPENVAALKDRVVNGNAEQFGTDANVAEILDTDEYIRDERWLADIEAQWGPAPGRVQSDGRGIFVLGAHFGNVFVGLQPGFGYEGDPMRLLFDDGFAPTHAFAAYYGYLRDAYRADAVVHFGTHGALEFMPGKQTALSENCWPDRLIGALPNFYLYAVNNPSEGAIAKRRSAATLISYLTPPLSEAGLYKELLDLKATIERWRSASPEASDEGERLAAAIREQALALDLFAGDAPGETALNAADVEDASAFVERARGAVAELEKTLIPCGLHVLGDAPSQSERLSMTAAIADLGDAAVSDAIIEAAAFGDSDAIRRARRKASPDERAAIDRLVAFNADVTSNKEIDALLHALDGGFIRPAPGGDVARTPAALPTGRNIHGFDPFLTPSNFAVDDGRKQAERVVNRHLDDGNALPETIALVLWGTDNLKTEGAPLAQALALMGARPRRDGYGRACGAELIPLEELGRPRIDVVVTLSGIFRDLLPMQTKMLAEAAYLAASADEPDAMNFVRKHALATMREKNIDLETASLRVFSNAEGAYGSNVNLLIDSSAWSEDGELADAFETRKSFAYGRSGQPEKRPDQLKDVLSRVELAYQNLDSVELGVTTIDHYMDTLGGVAKAVKRARGAEAKIYISDQTQRSPKIRTLSEQVALEARTRMLNPRWYESLLQHGHEGVRQIEASVTNTMGWSATTGGVAPWVFQEISETYVFDEELRDRMAELNPKACARMTNRLLEACERDLWSPDPETLAALQKAGDELDDRLEGVVPPSGAAA